MAKCKTCKKDMPDERLEFGLYHCSNCTDQTRPLGVVEYSHKTAGVLVITDKNGYYELKKGANARR